MPANPTHLAPRKYHTRDFEHDCTNTPNKKEKNVDSTHIDAI